MPDFVRVTVPHAVVAALANGHALYAPHGATRLANTWPSPEEMQFAPSSATRIFVATFRGEPEEVSRMRDQLSWDLDGHPKADDVILCASELAGNAVLHSDSRRPGGTFAVRAWVIPHQRVLIEIKDKGGPWIGRGSQADGGRGLSIVSALASNWGISPAAGSRVVWARFD